MLMWMLKLRYVVHVWPVGQMDVVVQRCGVSEVVDVDVVDGGHVSPVGQMVVVVDVGRVVDVDVDVDDGWQVSPVGQMWLL